MTYYRPPGIPDKVDSTQAFVATSGALQHFRTGINDTLANLHTLVLEHITDKVGVHPAIVYSTLAAILVALPLTMSRFGWSRGNLSPYSSMSGGAPHVTDADYSYITSQDIDAPTDSYYAPRGHTPSPVPEDDVLLVKNRATIYPAHFPPKSIADGKVLVQDVVDRVALMMELSPRTARGVKLLYKGRQLSDPGAPAWHYGVKHKSEIMAVVPEGLDASSPSDEEMVVVSKSQRRRKNKKKKEKASKTVDEGYVASGSSNAGASNVSTSSGPMKQIEDISSTFARDWKPLCQDFIAAPPSDSKKVDEEHRKLSESVMQHILLKLDGVETDGNPDIRAARKALVKEVQTVLKGIDAAKAAALG